MKHKEYTIKVSTRKNKKYDVFKGSKYITSFGDNRYFHYKDRIGHYSHLNHNDKQRRMNYRKRHQNDYINDPNYAGYWALKFLW